MLRGAVLLVVLASCGRIAFDPLGGSGDGGPGDAADASLIDSGFVGGRLAYIKASNPDVGDSFDRVALSGDGRTLVVGAREEASAAPGINGDETNNATMAAGAVYVYIRSGDTWSFQAYLKASNPGAFDRFGDALAVSSDGNTIAVGAEFEESAATGIDGNQADNSTMFAGAVYVFTRAGTTWSQQAYLKASNTGDGDLFGADVALSADGNIVAVGAANEDSAATGIDGNQLDNSANSSGAVYMFARSGTTWTQTAYIKASNTNGADVFGGEVKLSADGTVLAVSAPVEDGGATGVGGDQASNTQLDAGAVYVFRRAGASWAQEAYIKASNTGFMDGFGSELALSADGTTLAVSAPFERSNATGIDGDQVNNAANQAGAVYVFGKTPTSWTQQAYVKASNNEAGDSFGQTVALAGDGNTLVVGALSEDSSATGANGNAADNSAISAGAAYVFDRTVTTWSQRTYLKASNTEANDDLGWSASLSDDGSTLAIGAGGEDSGATLVDGNQADNSAVQSGAVYVLY